MKWLNVVLTWIFTLLIFKKLGTIWYIMTLLYSFKYLIFPARSKYCMGVFPRLKKCYANIDLKMKIGSFPIFHHLNETINEI